MVDRVSACGSGVPTRCVDATHASRQAHASNGIRSSLAPAYSSRIGHSTDHRQAPLQARPYLSDIRAHGQQSKCVAQSLPKDVSLVEKAEYKRGIERDIIKDTFEIKTRQGDHRSLDIVIDPFVFPTKTTNEAHSGVLYRFFEDLDCSGKNVLDLGTGSGVLALLAAVNGAAHVDAVDCQAAAVRCAKRNVHLNSLGDVVSVMHGNMFDVLENKRYDLIIANLPFVKSSDSMGWLDAYYDPGYRAHETLLSAGKKHLVPGGRIYVFDADFGQTGYFVEHQSSLEKLIDENGFQSKVVMDKQEDAINWKIYQLSCAE